MLWDGFKIFFFYILNKIEKLYVFYRETWSDSVVFRDKGVMGIYTNEDENDETL